jgi:hypothetical protein
MTVAEADRLIGRYLDFFNRQAAAFDPWCANAGRRLLQSVDASGDSGMNFAVAPLAGRGSTEANNPTTSV